MVEGRSGGGGVVKVTYHKDGSVTFWSVFGQVWERSSRLEARELAAMDSGQRERVLRHTGQYCEECRGSHFFGHGWGVQS
jgi:hypothetical protein